VVVEHLDASRLELAYESLRLHAHRFVIDRQREEMDLVRRDLWRPDNAFVVVMRLDDRLHSAPDADAVASADKRFLRAILGDERRAHLLRVVGAVGEDVSYFNAALDSELSGFAFGADVALAHVRGIDTLALEVAAEDHIAEMRVLLVRARDIPAAAHAGVHEDSRFEADWADVASDRSRGGEVGIARELDLAGRENLAKLRLVDVTVTRQHDRDDLARLIAEQERLQEGVFGLIQRGLERLDALRTRRRDLSGSRDALGPRSLTFHVTGRLFQVRAVVTVRADRDAVLPDLGEHLEFVRDVAAHRARVGFDTDRVKA